uniref:YopX protein n=1 Tax=Myoviridae sp. ctJ2i1 TaxID=2825079 RepID=A0A8S5V1C5_9CAUD|nr:MAG TPA: YopX protein [Myoviridae sp. ctJ2i1]
MNYKYKSLSNDNKIIIGQLFVDDKNNYFINGIPIDPKTIGQSTGLRDKYNQEIFINDIVHFKANYGDFTLELATATVGFDELNGRLAVKMNDNVLALCDMNYSDVEYEVLGNIWEGKINEQKL